jgi:hypothetical protein
MTQKQTETGATAGLKDGVVRELRLFLHVRPGHAEQLREESRNFIAAKNRGDRAVRKTGVHEASLTLFDNDKQFLLAASYDTEWEPYIEDVINTAGQDKFYDLLKHCVEVPEGREGNLPTVSEFRTIIEAHRVTASRYLRAYSATITEIQTALQLQKVFQQVLDNPDAAKALAHPALKPLLELAAD